ncbi:hypothetical protein KCU92_g373, partial [Aureobasidium melanogenum]
LVAASKENNVGQRFNIVHRISAIRRSDVYRRIGSWLSSTLACRNGACSEFHTFAPVQLLSECWPISEEKFRESPIILTHDERKIPMP